MPIEWKRGDMFASTCQTLVCPVNTVGVMGKGLALAANRRWPELPDRHEAAAKVGMFAGWFSVLWRGLDKWVLLVPTKDDWRNKSDLRQIDRALSWLPALIEREGITSLALPALGCELGGLRWADVRPLMERHLGGLDIRVEVYEPVEGDDGRR